MSFVVAALLLSAQVADQPAAVTPPVAAPAAPKKEKKICRVDDADSGSHMVRRICRTAEEWNQNPELGTGRYGFSASGESMQSH